MSYFKLVNKRIIIRKFIAHSILKKNVMIHIIIYTYIYIFY